MGERTFGENGVLNHVEVMTVQAATAGAVAGLCKEWLESEAIAEVIALELMRWAAILYDACPCEKCRDEDG